MKKIKKIVLKKKTIIIKAKDAIANWFRKMMTY